MKLLTSSQIKYSQKITEQMQIKNLSGFVPLKEVDGVKFPCCACANLERWTDEDCKKICQHYPK
jgi:hypothetical protein